jgi:Putative peptidoglycan binding domain
VAGRLVAPCVASLAALLLAGPAVAANPQIAGLQVALRAYGLYRGQIDAVAGPQTVAATKAFQRRAGLVPNGRADARTRRALGPLGRPLFGRRSLRLRRFGWDVSVLQFLLARRGALVPVDGYYDAATGRAVRRYQRARRLEVDGIAGPRTLAALARGQRALRPSVDAGLVVLRLLPGTRPFIETVFLRRRLAHAFSGGIQVGVVYLRHLLGESREAHKPAYA